MKLIVSSPAGSAPDIVARIVAEKLTAMWGQSVVVDNRGGPSGVVGAIAVARADADGHTFGVMQTAPITLGPLFYKDPQFNAYTDFKPVAMIGIAPLVIAAHPSLPANNMAEFIALAKAQPSKINNGLSLPNSVPHLVGEMISDAAGIKLYNVPYNGAAQATTATIAGDTQVTINALGPIMPHVKAGKLKALAISSPKRLPGYENVPTVGETIPGFSAYGWFAVFAPAKVSDAIADRVNADINNVLARPEVIAQLALGGVYPNGASRKEFAVFVKAEQDRWAAVVKKMGIKPE
ncbi:MAG TPA: tripartite tricarboxylate transporter substrate-binding protein [Ramlibacter sp.]|nr:tripartite tricarboxylate transporter substrate-binding protein [Ramlibacter sp.]